MEISRIDPYLVRWSADGVLALATESNGIELLSLDCKELLHEGRMKWTRAPVAASAPGRVIDMQWSPTLHGASGGCQLACVLDSGDAQIFESVNGAWALCETHKGQYSAVVWFRELLLLGDDSGCLHALRGSAVVWSKRPAGEGGRVVLLAAANDTIAMVSCRNECWTLRDETDWALVHGASPNRVVSVAIHGSALVIQRYGKLETAGGVEPLKSYLPGDLIAYEGEVAVVHADGQVSGSNKLSIPAIEGFVVGCAPHPQLPLVVTLVGADNVHKKEWEFPILSRQSVTLAIFPLVDRMPLPRRATTGAPAAWLALMADNKKPTETQRPPVGELSANSDSTDFSLKAELVALFRGPYFDAQRAAWFTTRDRRDDIVAEMRQAIAAILKKVSPVSKTDTLVVAFYCGSRHDQFTMRGDFIVDSFPADSSPFSLPSMVSQNGRKWRRCALTGLPLLSLDVLTSAEGEFMRYQGDTHVKLDKAEENPVTDSLLEAANFCIFTGTPWSCTRNNI